VLELKNPHSVLAALENRPEDVVEIRLSPGISRGAWMTVANLADKHNIPVVQSRSVKQGGRRSPKNPNIEGRRTATAIGKVKPKPSLPPEQLFSQVQGNSKSLWLALDSVQDPHNVGAILRTAAFFGVSGIVLTKDRSAPMNSTVYDVASGGAEYVPFTLQTTLVQTLKIAKSAGLWVLGTSEHAEEDVSEIDKDRAWLLVLGNEEKGLRSLTLKNCDYTCKFSPRGEVKSLNVSVAAGVMMSEFS